MYPSAWSRTSPSRESCSLSNNVSELPFLSPCWEKAGSRYSAGPRPLGDNFSVTKHRLVLVSLTNQLQSPDSAGHLPHFIVSFRTPSQGLWVQKRERMTLPWDKLTSHEKIEILRRELVQVRTTQHALASDLDGTWDALRETRAELGKFTKIVATLRALWPKNYSRAS